MRITGGSHSRLGSHPSEAVRLPGSVAGQNNNSSQRITGGVKRRLIRSTSEVATLWPFEPHILAQRRAFVLDPKQTTRL